LCRYYKGCNHNNFGDESIPLLTTTAQVGCKYVFPIPSFELVTISKIDVGEWYNEFQQSDKDYPYNTKMRKAVWRGSLLDTDASNVYESVQWKLSKSLHNHNLDFVDFGIDEVPNQLKYINFSPIGGIKPKFESHKDLQHYMAIIVVDRISKNEAFPSSLCYNSVVIMVDSSVVNYFHYDVKPWKHYIPVKADLSDLVDNIVFALNPKNGPIVKDIISAANQFCSERFTMQQLSHDMLDTWESYIRLLDSFDVSWKSQWHLMKDKVLHSRLYNMVQVT
jgi:Glycosyl transferase family 90